MYYWEQARWVYAHRAFPVKKKPMKKTFILLSAAAFTLVACNRNMEPQPTREAPDNAILQTKVISFGDEVQTDPGSFLIKFTAVPSETQLKAFLETMEGAVNVKPVFPSCKGKEALEKEFGLDRWYEVKLEEGAPIDKNVRSTALRADIQTVEYNAVVSLEDREAFPYGGPDPATKAVSSTFNDPSLTDQWHYNNQGSSAYSATAAKGADVNVKDVWSRLTCGDPDIIVAVIDEGVKYSHSDLKDNMWVNTGEIPDNGIDDDGNGYIDDVYGYNFVTEGPISWDQEGDSGHGTHCAGTIAAVNNNKRGVSGIAGGSGNGDGCRIMSCQIFSGGSGASASNTAKAFKYAADMGASVASCSFGYRIQFTSDNNYKKAAGSLEIDGIHYFEASKNNDVLDGNIAIFAAGNEAHSYAHYPGAYVDIISVSAFGPDFLPTYYTNYGPGCNISAPGGEAGQLSGSYKSMILSTLCSETNNGDDYGYMQGTSMACPHVSGVVALGLSYAKQTGKKFGRDEFKQMILSSVNDIDERIGAKGSKTYQSGWRGIPTELAMAPFYHQMGTGAIDAWRLMMKIEGTPTATAGIGARQWIDLTSVFGTASVSLTYLKLDVPSSTVSALGLQKIEPTNTDKYPAVVDPNGYAFVQFGRLYVHPTVIGSGKFTIHAIGGGDHLGGGDNPPGGMELSREFSLIARDTDGGNGTGGWL